MKVFVVPARSEGSKPQILVALDHPNGTPKYDPSQQKMLVDYVDSYVKDALGDYPWASEFELKVNYVTSR